MYQFRIGKAAQLLGVSPDTVRRWADQGRVATVRTDGGRRRLPAGQRRRAVLHGVAQQIYERVFFAISLRIYRGIYLSYLFNSKHLEHQLVWPERGGG